jgi:hypothetical protein
MRRELLDQQQKAKRSQNSGHSNDKPVKHPNGAQVLVASFVSHFLLAFVRVPHIEKNLARHRCGRHFGILHCSMPPNL